MAAYVPLLGDSENIVNNYNADFVDQCKLCELASESHLGEEEEQGSMVPVSFKHRLDFYPIYTRGKEMDRFKKMVEQGLTRLASHAMSGDTILGDILSTHETQSLRQLSTDSILKNLTRGHCCPPEC